MRILSKFRDYYDTVQGLSAGQDVDEQVYKRETSTAMLSNYAAPCFYNGNAARTRDRDRFYSDVALQSGVIGVCGQLHPFVAFYNEPNGELLDLCFSADELVDVDRRLAGQGVALVDLHREVKLTRAQQRLRVAQPWNSLGGLRYHRADVELWFDKQVSDPMLPALFLDERIPLFLVLPTGSSGRGKDRTPNFELTRNPNLGQWEFYRRMDAYSLYQEIDLYLSGVIGELERETITISDEVLLYEKGFNEWSFKTMPGSKKRRRRQP